MSSNGNSNMISSNDCEIMVLGDCNVGKSSLVKAIINGFDLQNDSLDQPLLGLKHNFKRFKSVSGNDDFTLTAKLWDRLNEHYLCVKKEDFLNKHGVLLCFDLTSKRSFIAMQQYLK